MVKYEYKYVSLEDAKKMESSEWRLVQVVGKTLIFEKVVENNNIIQGSNYWTLNKVTWTTL